MRDPYLYDDADVLKNLAGIKDADLLRKAEADITNLAMAGIYNRQYEKFDTETLKDIHRTIFGQIYEWAGEFREIQMIKPEDVLGGDTVRYAYYPKRIKKTTGGFHEGNRPTPPNGENDREIVFRMVRIIAQIWQTHPFREGNTRSVIVFAILFAKSLGFEVEHEMFRVHASYVRNALVWASQGIYSKYEYLERIFYDAVLGEEAKPETAGASSDGKYEKNRGLQGVRLQRTAASVFGRKVVRKTGAAG